MAWVAFDRAVKIVERFGLDGPARALAQRASRRSTTRSVREGFDRSGSTFVQYYGATQLDASLLMMPLVGFLPPDDPRVRGTVAAIERELMRRWFRPPLCSTAAGESTASPPAKGAFLPCTFWLADNYVLQGREREDAECSSGFSAFATTSACWPKSTTRRRAAARQLPAGVLARRPDQHGPNLSRAGGPAEHRQEGGSPRTSVPERPP